MHYGSVALVYLSADVVFVFAGHEWPYPGPIPGVALMDRFMKIVNIIGGFNMRSLCPLKPKIRKRKC